MTALDWLVLVGTLVAVAGYGVWRTRGAQSAEGYLRGGYQEKWWTVGLSVMATQASAITFLSTPGQAYEDGMRFVQFYFGLPIAMVILSITFIPIYYRLKVYTAYEFLEQRFDRKTRQLAAFLFLVQRGLSAGITVYAPAILLSSLLGWPLHLINVALGALVIVYTVLGGTRAVSQTQKHQMAIMLGGMALAFVLVVRALPDGVGLGDALALAGATGRMRAVDFSFDTSTRYTFWSGITGGLFLALSYFGTDQSQVGRYLAARSITESRLGLLFNGLLKVPMQFLILLVGLMVFVFHQFERPPLYFDEPARARAAAAAPEAAAALDRLDGEHASAFAERRAAALAFVDARRAGDPAAVDAAHARVAAAATRARAIGRQVRATIGRGRTEVRDTDHVFLHFVLHHLPRGIVGLLLAVIFCAAMSSTASELSALGSTTVVDFYRRSVRPDADDAHYVRAAQVATAAWGVFAILFATFASQAENLIQAVNILGSLFYGTILGIFLVAFYVRSVRATPVFIAALASEALVVTLHLTSSIGFLWFNVIGCAVCVALAVALDRLGRSRQPV